MRSRFKDVMVVKREDGQYGCLPRSVVHGTVSRRTADSLFVVGKQGGSAMGSDMFQAFQCSDNQAYVSADVDSQEMWIAGLLADSALEGNAAGLSPMRLDFYIQVTCLAIIVPYGPYDMDFFVKIRKVIFCYRVIKIRALMFTRLLPRVLAWIVKTQKC